MRNNEESATSLVATFPTFKHKIICSTLKHDRSLILIYNLRCYSRRLGGLGTLWFGSSIEERAIDIFTLEGYHVTRKIILEIKRTYFGKVIDNVRFTDHMIMICDGLFRPAILTDFSLEFPLFVHKVTFIEFDETGNIYTNGERNKIAVYSQNWEFKEVFEIDLPDDYIITSLHIRDDTMVVLSKENNFFGTVRRFVRSTGELVKYLKLPEFCPLNEICIDQLSNIILCTNNGIRIWQKNGELSPIMFGGKQYSEILLTNNYQLILITPNGVIHVHSFIDIVNYLC